MTRRIQLSFSLSLLGAHCALAQSTAPTPQAGTTASELPEITVTAPSPVAKPPKRKAKAPQAPAASPSPDPAPGAPSAEAEEAETEIPAEPGIAAAPGTLLVADDAFAPVTIVMDRDVLSSGGATLTDVLDTRPGITGSSFAPGSSRPIIRGLDSYRVRIQENGLGSHDVSTISEDHAVPIDPFAADRIEVVRGPATLRYGSGAIGGVVAAENQRIPTAMPTNGASGEIRGGLSSVDEGREGALRATAGSAGFVVHADAFRRASDDYDTPNGRVRNSFVDSDGFALGLSRVASEGFLGLSVSRFESLYGIPGEEAEEGVNPRIDLVQDKLQARGEWRMQAFGIDALRFWYGASDYAHNEFARHHHEEEEEAEGHEEEEEGFEVGSRFTNREHEARVELQHMPALTPAGELSGAIGVQLVHRKTRGQSFEGESLLEPARTASIAAFWFEELQASERLKLQVAGRIEETRIDGFGWSDVSDPDAPVIFDGERSFVPVSGSLGLLYELGYSTVARFNTQFVERAPDAAELFSKGIHEATGTFEIGNPKLEKEQAFSVEAGLARAGTPVRFDATAFYTRYQGFIFRQLTGVVCAEDLPSCGTPEAEAAEESFDQVLFQQRDATFYGVELAAELDIAPLWGGLWGIDGRYDFVHAQFEGGENVPRIPPHRLGGGLFWRSEHWLARAGLLHAFDQTRTGVNEIETPGYTLVSAELSYTQSIGPDVQSTIGLKGENLLDDEVLNHASFKRREGVLLPGASVRLFGSIKLN